MNILKEFKEAVASALDDYRDAKFKAIENIDTDTEYDIYKRTQSALSHIYEELEELDEDIDTFVEVMNDKTDYFHDALAAQEDALYSVDNNYYLSR